MASLTGQAIKDTYQSLLKVDDNGQITNIAKNITDGLGGSSGLYLTSTGVVISGSLRISGSLISDLQGTASYAQNSNIANLAYTASSADDFVVRGSMTASSLLVQGQITAEIISVNIISSSIVYSSGSNIFGNNLSDTQTFTGSVNITGSLSVDAVISASSFLGDGSQLTGISAAGSKNWLTSTTLTVLSSDTATFSTDFVAEDSIINVNSENKQYTIGAKTISKRGSIFISDDALLLDSSIVNDGVISVQGALILSGSTTITGTGILI
jgi:hypothetical protein